MAGYSNVKYSNSSRTSVVYTKTCDDSKVRIKECNCDNTNSDWVAISVLVDAGQITIDEYSFTPPTTALLRKGALQSVDDLVSQYTRRNILGLDTTEIKARIVAKQAEIDSSYPEAEV